MVSNRRSWAKSRPAIELWRRRIDSRRDRSSARLPQEGDPGRRSSPARGRRGAGPALGPGRGAPPRDLAAAELRRSHARAGRGRRLAPGDGAGPTWPTAEAVDCAGKIDALHGHASIPTWAATSGSLLRLFESGFLGTFIAGSPRPFTRAAPAEQDARLEAWRRSRFALLRSGYQALKRLAHATYYSSPEVYARDRLPGPARGAAGARVSDRRRARRAHRHRRRAAAMSGASRSTSRSSAAARAAASPPRCWPQAGAQGRRPRGGRPLHAARLQHAGGVGLPGALPGARQPRDRGSRRS